MSRPASTLPVIRRALLPVLLLAVAGLGIGSIFPVAKLASDAGVPPLTFAAGTAAAAAAVIVQWGRLSGDQRAPIARRRIWSYAVVAGPLTFGPFGLVALSVPHVGAGFQALLQSLVPALTVVLSLAVGLGKPGWRSGAGLALGCLGAVVIIRARFAGFAPPAPVWLAVALAAPAILAAGNVFRSLRWPTGATPVQMAAPTLAVAALLLALASPLAPVPTAALDPGIAAVLVGGQGVATGLGYVAFFRLQQVGGPVYLSQVSYVNAAVGMAIAVAILGERLSITALAGAGLILAGLLVSGRPGQR